MLARYHHPKAPPRTVNFDGAHRHVGIELEFAALSARDVANEIHKAFGGTIVEKGRHRFAIEGTRLGSFKTELDTRYAHKPDGEQPPGDDPIAASFQSIADALREIYGDISALIVPCEIVAPPLGIAQIADIDSFVTELTKAGALGTASSAFYAFGTHLNPDIATRDPQWILAVLKAEIILSEWLREVMAIDLTRWISSFADPFPYAYVQKVLDTTYWPDTGGMISDYLEHNPTRDRELDMLPLFAWLEPGLVREALPAAKIGARPTFHFRLPNANLGVAGWSVGLEWNRWCVIERLAEDRELIDAMCRAYLENSRRMIPDRWSVRASEWLIV